MHARMSRYQGSPEEIDESVRIGREKSVPAARQLDGFNGVLALANRQSGEQIVITLWESEEAMRASEDAANRIRDEGLTEGEEVASVGRYEVTMDERN